MQQHCFPIIEAYQCRYSHPKTALAYTSIAIILYVPQQIINSRGDGY